ncbi:MAG: hypothetical protein FWG52_09725 [Proteobacteria bacterium]|nr:hypothetical protein [Pseudomonadota bacterium]
MSRYVVSGLEFRMGGKRYADGAEIELPDADAKKFSRWLKPVGTLVSASGAGQKPAPATKNTAAKEPKQ